MLKWLRNWWQRMTTNPCENCGETVKVTAYGKDREDWERNLVGWWWGGTGVPQLRLHLLDQEVGGVAEHGSAKVPKGAVVDGVKLGSWVKSVRNRYRRGSLSEERVRRLEGLPG